MAAFPLFGLWSLLAIYWHPWVHVANMLIFKQMHQKNLLKQTSSNLHSLHGTHSGVFVDGYMIPLGIMDASLSKWSHDACIMQVWSHIPPTLCHNLSRLHPPKQPTMELQTEWTMVIFQVQVIYFFQQFPSSTSCHLSYFQRRSSPPQGSTGDPDLVYYLDHFEEMGWNLTYLRSGKGPPMLCCSNEDSEGFNLGILV